MPTIFLSMLDLQSPRRTHNIKICQNSRHSELMLGYNLSGSGPRKCKRLLLKVCVCLSSQMPYMKVLLQKSILYSASAGKREKNSNTFKWEAIMVVYKNASIAQNSLGIEVYLKLFIRSG